jgi:hypothetical protein
MKQAIHAGFVCAAAAIAGCGSARAQDGAAAIGLNDPTTAVERARVFEDGKAMTRDLLKEGFQHGGVAEAARPFVEQGGALAKQVFDLETEKAGDDISRIGDRYWDGMAVAAKNQEDLNGSAVDPATTDTMAKLIDAQKCRAFPDACPKPIANQPEEVAPPPFVCVPIAADPEALVEAVRRDSQLAYRNECTIGSATVVGFRTFESRGYIVVDCRGWHDYAVELQLPEIPDHTYNADVRREDGAVIFRGNGFATPCRPLVVGASAPGISNFLQGLFGIGP